MEHELHLADLEAVVQNIHQRKIVGPLTISMYDKDGYWHVDIFDNTSESLVTDTPPPDPNEPDLDAIGGFEWWRGLHTGTDIALARKCFDYAVELGIQYVAEKAMGLKPRPIRQEDFIKLIWQHQKEAPHQK